MNNKNGADKKPKPFIHETAHVSPMAVIGHGTKVWINSQIREKAVIGEDCVISKDTYIDSEVRIGSGVKIQNGVSVYHGVTIEDEAFIGPNAVFTNDYYPRSFNTEWKIVETLVKRGASIGANATVICGIIIGEYSMIGAGSVVLRDVPDHALVVGNPARIVGWVCRCGARLDERGTCIACGEIYAVGRAEKC